MAILNVNGDVNELLLNSKKTSLAVEARRKALQQFMKDLSKIDVIRNSDIYKEFIKFDENIHALE